MSNFVLFLQDWQRQMKGDSTMALIKRTLTAGTKPTPEQLARIHEAAKRPITFDEDCPELTDDQLLEFRKVKDTTPEERKRIAIEGAEGPRVTLAPDVYSWLKKNGIDYQEQVNKILREAMLAKVQQETKHAVV
jgi:uncharacterized protein (DUF4415 family)